MTDFRVHTRDTLPEGGTAAFDRVEKAFGMVPNLIGIMAESPTTAQAYLDLHERLGNSSLTPVEQQVATLTVSYLNGCQYCMAAESGVAKMVGMDDGVLEALRGGDSLSDERLEALRSFTSAVVENRGWAGEEAVQAFLDAGFTRAQVLEVVLAVTKKTLSNYVNHLAGTPVDEAFAEFRWEAQEKAGV